jgi:hypothetical protein
MSKKAFVHYSQVGLKKISAFLNIPNLSEVINLVCSQNNIDVKTSPRRLWELSTSKKFDMDKKSDKTSQEFLSRFPNVDDEAIADQEARDYDLFVECVNKFLNSNYHNNICLRMLGYGDINPEMKFIYPTDEFVKVGGKKKSFKDALVKEVETKTEPKSEIEVTVDVQRQDVYLDTINNVPYGYFVEYCSRLINVENDSERKDVVKASLSAAMLASKKNQRGIPMEIPIEFFCVVAGILKVPQEDAVNRLYEFLVPN